MAPVTAVERKFETATLIHVTIMAVGAAWAFGGNAVWAKNLIGLWGSLCAPLLMLIVRDTINRRHCPPRALHLLWPLLALNLVVAISWLFPGYRALTYQGEVLLVRNPVGPFVPSSAQPVSSLRALWLFDVIYLSCFNLLLAIKSRHGFRLLLYVLTANALLLAVFGTIQKLVKAPGLFFGLQPSPQTKFFASFIYHNHWGAFALLMMAAGLGLLFHLRRRNSGRELLNTPAPFLVVAVALLAIASPLSGSRSCSVMMLLLLVVAFAHWSSLVFRLRHQNHKPNLWPVLGATLILGLVGTIAYDLGKPMIHERLSDTRGQLAALQASDGKDFRMQLYRDTLAMAGDRWLFGWGMGSYPIVFQDFNSQSRSPVDRLPRYFHDAHSDWLQSLAELGVVGTGLLGLCGLLPLWHFRHGLGRSPISWYLLGSNALLLLYALIEFPFGNTAVVIAFWLCFFTALPYGRMETDRAT